MKTKKQIKEEIERLELEREKVKGTFSEHPLNFKIIALNWVLEAEETDYSFFEKRFNRKQ